MEDLQLVREALDEVAGRVGARPPDRTRIDRGIRRVRRRRRTARAGQAVGGLTVAAAAVVALQAGLVSLPPWAPAVPVGPTAASVLAGQPTRGSLAGDEAWLRALREKVATFDRSESGGERWRVPSAADVDVLFAGDVGGYRIALVEAPTRWGMVESRQQMWYRASKGAPAAEMTEGGNAGPSDIASATFGPENLPVPATGYAGVVLGPPGLVVEQVGPAAVGADGQVSWPRRPLPETSPGAWTVATPSDGARTYLRWAGTDPVPVGTSGWDVPTGAAAASLVEGVLPAERVGAPSGERLVASVSAAQYACGLAAAGTTRRLVWSGTLDGLAADVVRVTAPSGGGAVVALGAFGEPTLRPMAVAPVAAGADAALAWSYPGVLDAQSAPGPSPAQTTVRWGGPARVGLVGPADATSARVVTASGATTVVPLSRGVGSAGVEAAARAEFLDAGGAVVGRTTVQAYLPGDDVTLLPPRTG